ncbi:MAG TPA: hypothetical protein VI977_01065 [archaeon]|nr:hypothetical protein [archaeon]
MKNKKLGYGILVAVILIITVAGWFILPFTPPERSEYTGIPDISDRPNILGGYTVYTSAEDRFRIQYPKGVGFGSPRHGENGCKFYSTYITITVCPEPQKTDKDSLLNFLAEVSFLDSTEKITIVSDEFQLYKKFSFSGFYSGYNRTRDFQTEGKIIIHDEKIYILDYRLDPSEFNDSIEEARRIMNTFEIITSDASPKCYCSYCAGDCVLVDYRAMEECPPKTPEEVSESKCAKEYCIYEDGKCKAKPLPIWE